MNNPATARNYSRFCVTHSLAAVLLCLLPLSVISSPDAWTEKSISQHLDIENFSGTLHPDQLDILTEHGRQLFTAKFTPADGVGRPLATQAIIPTKRKHPPRQAFSRTAGMDANACSSCHNDPGTGGAGDFSVNVFVSEGFNNADFDNTDPQFSNERNTNHLFGAGLIELLSREMSTDLTGLRTEALESARHSGKAVRVHLTSKSVSFGYLRVLPDGFVDTSEVDGVDPDLIIRPFGQKGVMTSLRQFTINALNHHHGMQAAERYGARWTGESDFDADNVANEMTSGDISALVAWQATLKPPQQSPGADPQQLALVNQGSTWFKKTGCAECHRPTLPLHSLDFTDPGPLDYAGTLRVTDVNTPALYDLSLQEWAKQLPRAADGSISVPLYGDLKRHRIADQEVAVLGNELLAQRFVDRDVFITAELWGVGSTAPYGHRGDLTTLDEVIRAHGGEARESRERYLQLDELNRRALISFLKTLVISP